MYKIAKPMFLIAETPIHAGSGSDLGYIDNPIQREKHTGYPKIEASSLKGALRQAFEAKAPEISKDKEDFINYSEKLNRVFGFDEDGMTDDVKKHFGDQKDFAGAIGFTDARILLFPVKSLKGTFAYITCPRVLAKFKYELNEICYPKISETWTTPSLTEGKVLVTEESSLKLQNSAQVQLDEYIYDIAPNAITEEIITLLSKIFPTDGLNIGSISENLAIVSDNDFADFVKFGTEVSTRIKIDNETGTVKEGALFTVEYLPAETVMYSLVMFSPEFRKDGMNVEEVEKFFNHKPQYFQLGGDATLGKGILNLQVPKLQIKKETKS